jgi:hypothetical protein
VKSGGKNHAVIRPQARKLFVTPPGGELSRQLGMIFLRADKAGTILQFSNNHLTALLC